MVIDGFLTQSRSNGGSEQWSNSEYIMKAELVEFSDRLDMGFK